jgi:2-furoyl-CoA dehydrogenase large subunit
LAYDQNGNFLSGTFADYLCPTAMEVPPIEIGHVETASPMNRLGAKGMGDGSSMLTPAALANAVADALGRDDVMLPLTLQRVWALANGRDPERARSSAVRKEAVRSEQSGEGLLSGEGQVEISAPVEEVWRRLIDPEELRALVPGCQELHQESPDQYTAKVLIGVAGIRGIYDAEIELRDKREPSRVRLVGRANGALGFGSGSGDVTLAPLEGGRTLLTYRYDADVGGKVAAVGQRMLGSVTRFMIRQFFQALERRVGGQVAGWRRFLPWARKGASS